MRRMAVLLSLVLLGAAATHALERAIELREAFPADADLLYLPAPVHLQRMSLGYDEALADLIWIRALLFSGEHLGNTNIAWTDRYVDAINTLAPRFRRPYIWGGVTAVYGGQRAVTRSMVDRAIVIYERGLRQFPEDHEILYPFGMLLLHQVGSTPGYAASEREAHRRRGVELVRRAAAFGADPLVRQYAATLTVDYASRDLAIQFLEAQLLEANDAGYRRMLRAKLTQLAGEQSMQSVETLRREFFEERSRLAAYVPDTLWAVIRPEQTPPATTGEDARGE